MQNNQALNDIKRELREIKTAQLRGNRLLERILRKENIIMADLSKVTKAVEDIETVDGSILKLIDTLVEEIKAAGTDQVALDALTDRLAAQKQALADAVVANTPAAP